MYVEEHGNQAVVYALRHIEADEELLLSYGEAYWKARDSRSAVTSLICNYALSLALFAALLVGLHNR